MLRAGALKSEPLEHLAGLRGPIQASADALSWLLAMWLANAVRWDFREGQLAYSGLAALAGIAALLQLGLGAVLHLYRGRYRFGSFEEVAGVVAAVGSTGAAITLLNLAQRDRFGVPRSVPGTGALFTLVLAVGVRYAWRLFLERRTRPSEEASDPLLVFGAGAGADQALAAMLRDREGRYVPVGILDDDPRKRNLRIRGVRVLGTRAQIASAAADTGARTLLIAVPSAGAALVRDISALAEAAGLSTKVLPPVDQLIDGQVNVEDIRDLDLADLLGRRQIQLDLGSIAHYLTGKRVLVTGAGGSIGSELCRQLATYGPSELMMLDRDESSLHAVQLSITGRALLDSEDLILADIRDIAHLNRIFEERKPQVVFHAAALKHLTLLERHPGEAIKSNVWGTLAVLEAARAGGVERFVNISTDKAANPESVLGYSKRIAERLTAYVAGESEGLFLSVRFGNVLGSRGSVLTAFTAQIEAGGPVTVTHRDVTRYFMTVQEAVQLVIQAAAVGADGEVLVLDMGEPVRIDDVARRLVDDSSRRVEIVYTGLRPGEKLHEDLIGTDEVDSRPRHPLVSQIPVPAITPVAALELDPWATDNEILADLRALATGDRSAARLHPRTENVER